MIAEPLGKAYACEVGRVPAWIKTALQCREDQLCADRCRKPHPAVVGFGIDFDFKPGTVDGIAGSAGNRTLFRIEHQKAQSPLFIVRRVGKTAYKIARPVLFQTAIKPFSLDRLNRKAFRKGKNERAQLVPVENIALFFDRVAGSWFGVGKD